MRMRTADLRVIIPTWNRGQALIECVDSLHRQTVLPKEVVVVDDGSTDDSSDLLSTWQKDNPGIPLRYQFQENSGPAIARNRGAVDATTEWLAFLDSDDLWPEDFIERFVDRQMAVPEADCFIFDIRDDFYSDDQVIRSNFRSNARFESDTLHSLFSFGHPGTPALVVRRSVFERSGGFAEFAYYGEDLMLFLKLGFLGRWVHCSGEPVERRILDRPEGSLRRRPKFERDLRNALTYLSAHQWAEREVPDLTNLHSILLRRVLAAEAGMFLTNTAFPEELKALRSDLGLMSISGRIRLLCLLSKLCLRRVLKSDQFVEVDPSPYFLSS